MGRIEKVTKDIKQWTSDSIDRLQGCFETTDWNTLTFCSTNITEKKEVNREVKRAIKIAKLKFKNKVEQTFEKGNLRAAWQGIKNMAAVNSVSSSCKPIQVAGSSSTSLPNDLNSFYTRFEKDNSIQLESIISTLRPDDYGISINTSEVVRALKRTKKNTAPGPDDICGQTLWHCAEQLGVIPIPKKGTTRVLNDLRPVALTSLVMKAMERIIKEHITKATSSMMDPLQFAYQAGRGVDDAKIFILNIIHKHLEIPSTSARLLFADFSSAFNTMQPHILAEKLITRFHLNHQLILWIIDFLTNRSQRVLVNHTLSDNLFTSTGSPQGCVLSPLLFILYTDDCRSTQPNCHCVKFADDTVLLSLLSSNTQHHSPALQDFLVWCEKSCLELNIDKTKDMIVTFSSKQRQLAEAVTTIIQQEPVEIVETYKYLGSTFDNLLSTG
ncbi:unnamed protein product [Leuciscus chuanchicus]